MRKQREAAAAAKSPAALADAGTSAAADGSSTGDVAAGAAASPAVAGAGTSAQGGAVVTAPSAAAAPPAVPGAKVEVAGSGAPGAAPGAALLAGAQKAAPRPRSWLDRAGLKRALQLELGGAPSGEGESARQAAVHVSHEYVALANLTYNALKRIVRNSQHGFCTTVKALDDADALVVQMHELIAQHAIAEEQNQVSALRTAQGASVAVEGAVCTEGAFGARGDTGGE